MLDSIYHMTLKLLKKYNFWHEKIKILPSFTQQYNGIHYVTLLNLVYPFYCMVLHHSQTGRHVIKHFITKSIWVGCYEMLLNPMRV